MKKIIFYSVAIAALTFTSCAKEYTCDCEIEDKETGQGYNYSNKFEESVTIKAKSKSAEAACDDLEYSESKEDNNGYKHEVIQKCKLK